MGKELIDLMENGNALLYACGDLKNFSKDMWACLSTIIQQHLSKLLHGYSAVLCDSFFIILIDHSPNDAIELLKKWRAEERFIEDVWS